MLFRSCAPPGSRRCTCISIRPGATISPAASITGTDESRGAAVLSDKDAEAPTLEEALLAGRLPGYDDCVAYQDKLRA